MVRAEGRGVEPGKLPPFARSPTHLRNTAFLFPPPHTYLHSNACCLSHCLHSLVLLHPLQIKVGVFIGPLSTCVRENKGGGGEREMRQGGQYMRG